MDLILWVQYIEPLRDDFIKLFVLNANKMFGELYLKAAIPSSINKPQYFRSQKQEMRFEKNPYSPIIAASFVMRRKR